MALTWPSLTEGEWELIASNIVNLKISRLKVNVTFWITTVNTGETAPVDAIKLISPKIFEQSGTHFISSLVATDVYIWIENSDETEDSTFSNLIEVNTGETNTVPLELNGGVPINTQDQTTRPIIVKFNEVSNSTTLATPAVKGAYTIDVTLVTGFADGKYIILFDPISENFSVYTQIGAPAGNIVTLDTPIDFAYPAGTFVDAAITNMNVNGSVTPRVFGLRGTGSPPGVDIEVDITRIIISCIAASVVDLSTFADIAALTRGLVLRKRDGTIQNIFNVKTNGEIAGIMYDFNATAAINPQQGTDGFVARLTFGGQSKIGVVVRLPIGEDLELIVQDNLTGITKLEIMAEGHVVSN